MLMKGPEKKNSADVRPGKAQGPLDENQRARRL